MKKLTKKSLEQLAKEMPVLSESVLMTYIGGSDPNDCWWRCISYLKTCGEDYSEEAAMAIASGYYGDDFNENSYAFSGSGHDHKDFASNYFAEFSESCCSGQILVFDPITTPGWSGNGTSKHAVIITGYDGLENVEIFDPQTGESSTINRSDLSKNFVVNVR